MRSLSLTTVGGLAAVLCTLSCPAGDPGAPRVETAVLDHDGDGRNDFAVARGGDVWIRLDVASPGGSWKSVPLGPRHDGMRLVSLDMDGDGHDDLVAGAAEANEAKVIRGSAGSRLDLLGFPVIGGPTAMAATDGEGRVPAGLHVLAMDYSEPSVLVIRWLQDAGREMDGPLASERFTWPAESYLADDTVGFSVLPGGEDAWFAWIHRRRQDAPDESAPVLTWFDLDPATHRVRKATDVTLKRGIIDGAPVALPGGGAALMVWAPETSELQFHGPDADPLVEQLDAPFRHVSAFDSRDHDSSGIAAVAIDGSRVGIYAWSARGELERIDTIRAMDGERLESAVAFGLGGLITLETGAGMPAPGRMTVHRQRNGRFERVHSEDLPAPSRPTRRPNVRVYDANPFADPGARPIANFTVGDWTREAHIENGEIVVTVLTFLDAILGLGNPTVERLAPGVALPAQAVAFGNQAGSDISLYFGDAGLIGPAGPEAVSVSPAGGSYPRAVRVRFQHAAGVTVQHRLSGGGWSVAAGPIVVSETAVLEFYGVSGGVPGPRQTASYVIGEPANRPSELLRADADGDGIDDAWERLLFGSTERDPDLDSDGDGYTDAEEYAAATHPLNPASRPEIVRNRVRVQLDIVTGGHAQLRWLGTEGAAYSVEVAEFLGQWIRSSSVPVFLDGAWSWTDPDPPAMTRFYRVVRPD